MASLTAVSPSPKPLPSSTLSLSLSVASLQVLLLAAGLVTPAKPQDTTRRPPATCRTQNWHVVSIWMADSVAFGVRLSDQPSPPTESPPKKKKDDESWLSFFWLHARGHVIFCNLNVVCEFQAVLRFWGVRNS